MVGIESFGGNVQAVSTVGIVLVEAIVLYVGYGALSRVMGDEIMDAVRGE
ncbi:DUF7512 family protein [Haladaptatus sp. NG-SE-30]